MMGHLLLVVASFLGATQLSLTRAECEYPACVFNRVPNKHLIESAFIYLNFTALPNSLPVQCPRIFARADNCSSLYRPCPRTVHEDFSQRYQDGAFVYFLMLLGTYVCTNLQGYMGLKECFTEELETALSSCITDRQFDIPCLSRQYNNTNTCSNYNSIVFHYHINLWIPMYPYNNST
ncbi:hypothetical protein BsWGS_16274 [Bradybaena similaris]